MHSIRQKGFMKHLMALQNIFPSTMVAVYIPNHIFHIIFSLYLL